MMIESKKRDMTADKELKVKIPISYHLHLHSIKLLTGQQISTTIEEALDLYFARMQEARAAGAVEVSEPAVPSEG